MVATYTPIAIAPTIKAVVMTPLLFLFSAISYAETLPKFQLLLVALQNYDKRVVQAMSTQAL
jgi:hypothetical protein